MAEETLSARLVEIESMLDRSRRRFEEGTRLVEDAHKLLKGSGMMTLLGGDKGAGDLAKDGQDASKKCVAAARERFPARFEQHARVQRAAA